MRSVHSEQNLLQKWQVLLCLVKLYVFYVPSRIDKKKSTCFDFGAIQTKNVPASYGEIKTS